MVGFMEHIEAPLTVSDICDKLGRKAIAERLNVGATAVSNASVEQKFPAAWYAVIREMCGSSGIDCPLDAFNWKGTDARRLPQSGASSVDGAA